MFNIESMAPSATVGNALEVDVSIDTPVQACKVYPAKRISQEVEFTDTDSVYDES